MSTFLAKLVAGEARYCYEIALFIQTGDAVWINGPFRYGIYNNLTILLKSLMTELAHTERVEADGRYIVEHAQHVKCPAGFAHPSECVFMQQRVRNRQETINNRLEFWGILLPSFTRMCVSDPVWCEFSIHDYRERIDSIIDDQFTARPCCQRVLLGFFAEELTLRGDFVLMALEN
jgi:hypothetical protein